MQEKQTGKKETGKEKILRTAIAIANRDGLEAISMHAIAREIKVKTPSLYKHVSGLQEVHDALHAAGLAALLEKVSDIPRNKSSKKRILLFAEQLTDFAQNSPALYQAIQISYIEKNEEIEQLGEKFMFILFSLFSDYQLSQEELIHVVRSFRSMLHGFLDLNRHEGFKLKTKLDESMKYGIDMLLSFLEEKQKAKS